MLKIVIAIFSILGLSLISSLIAAAAPGWIIGKWVNGHEISGSLLWIYYQNIKFSYSAIDDHFKLNGLGKHLFSFCSSCYSYPYRLPNITYDLKLQIVKSFIILQHET